MFKYIKSRYLKAKKRDRVEQKYYISNELFEKGQQECTFRLLALYE